MIKKLVKVGSSKAVVLNKTIMELLRIDLDSDYIFMEVRGDELVIRKVKGSDND